MQPSYPGSPHQPGHYPPQQGYPTQYPPQQEYPSYVPQYQPQGYSSGGPPQPGYPPQGQQAYPSQGFFNAPPQVKTVKNRCTVNYSKTMGITTGFFEKGSSPSLKGFPTYQMELHYVDEIFQGKTQPWNRKYDKAAQIYGFEIF